MAFSAKTVIYAALAGNLLVAITKFAAATLTGSSAMTSEGFHSFVDTANEVLLLHGENRAARPSDEMHPLGHGRELYFWSFAVAVMIFAAWRSFLRARPRGCSSANAPTARRATPSAAAPRADERPAAL